jgi:hypothetical protein
VSALKAGTGAAPSTTALPAGDKAELWLDGADHMSFGGQEAGRRLAQLRRPAPARQQAARHCALIEAVSSDWWRAQLLDDSRGAPPPFDRAGRPARLGMNGAVPEDFMHEHTPRVVVQPCPP